MSTIVPDQPWAATCEHHATDLAPHRALAARCEFVALTFTRLFPPRFILVLASSEDETIPQVLRDEARCVSPGAVLAFPFSRDQLSAHLRGCETCEEEILRERAPGTVLGLTIVRGRHAFHEMISDPARRPS